MAITLSVSVADKIRRWHRAGVTRRQLNALSNAQLADIGLERGQIGDLADGLMTHRDSDAATPATSPAASVERGMNLSPLFHAYLPRARP